MPTWPIPMVLIGYRQPVVLGPTPIGRVAQISVNPELTPDAGHFGATNTFVFSHAARSAAERSGICSMGTWPTLS